MLQRLLGQGVAKSGSKLASGRVSAARQSAGGAANAPSLRKRIASQLRAIDPAWPDAVPRALEIHVRAMLTEQFGGEVASDPAFGGLLADVVDAIRQHGQYDALADYLRQQLQLAHK
ncbi:hypothetical protein BI347_00020 [Chromobacterium sphagni]|uniref:Uncharacterized protein n=2 Tax=Chromobacterium sphagni TaxID=1903179 RepID=A0A1S1WXP1_9NEIS|nr:hypothetical protein BI347_00020 [Chromobacterium sphagni]